MAEPYDPVRRFNDRAQIYDSDVINVIPGYTELHKESGNLLRDALGTRAKVLVCGSGTGHEAVSYALQNPGWEITGFDPAPQMVQVASEKAKAEGVENRVRFILGTAKDLPLDEFDGATSILVKHFISYDDKPSFLENISKRLEPGAVFITVDITGRRGDPELEANLEEWERFQRERRDDPEEIVKSIERVRIDLPILTEDQTAALLLESGFKNVRRFWHRMMIKGFVAEKG